MTVKRVQVIGGPMFIRGKLGTVLEPVDTSEGKVIVKLDGDGDYRVRRISASHLVEIEEPESEHEKESEL